MIQMLPIVENQRTVTFRLTDDEQTKHQHS